MNGATIAGAEGLMSALEVFFYDPTIVEAEAFSARGLAYAIATVTSFSPASSSTRQNYRETVAICELPERFPQFHITPKVIAGAPVLRAMGIPTTEFPEAPEFSKAFVVTGNREKAIRAVLQPKLLAELAARPYYCVEAKENCVTFYRRNQVCPASKLPEFSADAEALLPLFAEGLKRAQPALREKVDVHEMANRLEGTIGRAVRKRLFTLEEARAFAQSAPPRRIPRQASVILATPLSLALVGFAIGFLGALFAWGFGNIAVQLGTTHEWGGVAFGSFVALIGLGIAFFAGRSYERKWRLLRRGVLAQAQIEAFEPPVVSTNGQLAKRVRLRFAAQSAPGGTLCSLDGDAVLRARRLFIAKRPASILYDPKHPERVLYLDSLVTQSLDYDTD